MCMILAVFFSITEGVARERPESFRPERGFEPSPLGCRGAVLQRLSYKANRELIVMKVDDKPAKDIYISYVNT